MDWDVRKEQLRKPILSGSPKSACPFSGACDRATRKEELIKGSPSGKVNAGHQSQSQEGVWPSLIWTTLTA